MSAFLSLFGVEAFEPAAINEVFETGVDDVCGNEHRLSVARNRAALRVMEARSKLGGTD